MTSRPKILCLHGKRTNDDIMSMQIAPMSYNVGLKCSFLSAPLPANGPPSPIIGQLFPGEKYYEWYYFNNGEIIGIDDSIDKIVSELSTKGPFDGILGFSQGAEIMTVFLSYLNENKIQLDKSFVPKFAIAVCGVITSPISAEFEAFTTNIPSLHLLGENDDLKPHGENLLNYYVNKTVIVFPEGHQMPSAKSGCFDRIRLWLENAF